MKNLPSKRTSRASRAREQTRQSRFIVARLMIAEVALETRRFRTSFPYAPYSGPGNLRSVKFHSPINQSPRTSNVVLQHRVWFLTNAAPAWLGELTHHEQNSTLCRMSKLPLAVYGGLLSIP